MASRRIIRLSQLAVVGGLVLVLGSVAIVHFTQPAMDSITMALVGFIVPMIGGAMVSLGGFAWRFECNTIRMYGED